DGWSIRDVLRLCYPKPPSAAYRSTYDWICCRELQEDAPAILAAYKQAHSSEGDVVDRALAGIQAGLPREALPTEALADTRVWRALLTEVPMHVLLDNLANLSS